MSQSNKAKVARGAAWVSGARIVTIVVGLASTVILARLLTPSDFGLVAIALSITAIITSLSNLSLSQALIQQDDLQPYHFDTAFTLNLIRSLLSSLILIACAIPASLAYEDGRIGDILLVTAITAFIGGFENPRLAELQRELLFWPEFVMRMVEKLGGFMVVVAIAYYFQSFWALVIGTTASQAFKGIASYLIISYRPRLSLKGVRDLLSFSIWISLGNLVNAANSRLDPLVLGFFVPVGPLGYYTFSDNLAKMPLREGLFPLRQTLFPAFANIKTQRERLQNAYLKAQGVMALLAFPACLGFAALAEPIVVLFLGEKWLPAVLFIQIIAASAALQAANGFQPIAMALGQTRNLFGFKMTAFVIRLPFLLAGAFLGVHFLDDAVLGAVLALAVLTPVVVIYSNFKVKNVAGIPIFRQYLVQLPAAIAAIGMWAVLMLAQQFFPIVTVSLASFVQLFAYVGLGALSFLMLVWTLWLLRGRPDGAELELVRMGMSVLTRISARFNRKGDQAA